MPDLTIPHQAPCNDRSTKEYPVDWKDAVYEATDQLDEATSSITDRDDPRHERNAKLTALDAAIAYLQAAREMYDRDTAHLAIPPAPKKEVRDAA